MAILRIQFYIDEDLYPELFQAISSIQKDRLRAERVRVLATMGLMVSKAESLTDLASQIVVPQRKPHIPVPSEPAKGKAETRVVTLEDKPPAKEPGPNAQVTAAPEVSSLPVAMTPATGKSEASQPQETQEHPGRQLAMRMALRGEFGARSVPKAAGADD